MKPQIVDIYLNGLIQSVNDDLSLNSMKIPAFLLRSTRSIKDLWSTLGLFAEDFRNTLRLFAELAIEFGYSPEKKQMMVLHTMIRQRYEAMKKVAETYSLIRKLSSTDGSNVAESVLDRVMYGAEALPPLGKEYWWLFFFGQDGEKPMQLSLFIFRKRGRKMLFNGKEMILGKVKEGMFQAVTAGWIYDGAILHDLGDTNAVTEVHSEEKRVFSEISGRKMILSGTFPNYRLQVRGVIDLHISDMNRIADKNAEGIFIPPFGVGWVDAFLDAKGTVLGKTFRGTAHLQKVIGITIFGSFHWGRVVFQEGSSISFFCIKAGKDSKRYFRSSIVFRDRKNDEMVSFDNPTLKIWKEDEGRRWVVQGHSACRHVRIVLASYAQKRYTMKGRGSQVYEEYAVVADEFCLDNKGDVISLDDLVKGVGTIEDAYGWPI